MAAPGLLRLGPKAALCHYLLNFARAHWRLVRTFFVFIGSLSLYCTLWSVVRALRDTIE